MIVLKVDMTVKPGTEEKCREYLRMLQEHTRKEPGCLLYLCNQSMEDPRNFLIYEQYKDADALEAHRHAPYFKQYVNGGLDAVVEQRSRELFVPLE